MSDQPTRALSAARPTAAVWVGFAALGAAFLVCFPLTDTDIWWHMAAGREMYTRLRFIYEDPFAYSMPHARWIDLHWLFQLLATGVFYVGGAALLVAAKCALVALSCLILIHAVPGRRVHAVHAVACCLLVYQVRYMLDMRPVVLTLVWLSLFLWLLERHAATGGRRYLWLLLPVQVLWTNSQGLFALGWLVAGAYATGALVDWRLKRSLAAGGAAMPGRRALDLALTVPALVLAALVNPYGIHALAFPWRLAARIAPCASNIFSANISENAPLLTLWPAAPGQVIAVAAAALAGAAAMVINRRRARASHAFLWAGFLALAIMAERNAVLFLLVSLPLIGANLSEAWVVWSPSFAGRRYGRALVAAASCVGLIAVALPVLRHAAMLARCPAGEWVSPFCVPEGAVTYLRAHWVPGAIFNSIRNGGYLLWKLYPTRQVYIDSRLVIRGPEFFGRYLKTLDDPRQFDDLRRHWGITHVLLPVALFPRDRRLVRHLYRDPAWRLVHTDGAHVLFVLDSLAATPQVDLGDPSDFAAVAASIDERWKRASFVRRQAHEHLRQLVALVSRGEDVVTP